jgi:molybdopterin-guanine dinucleotide biosynthesis protein B
VSATFDHVIVVDWSAAAHPSSARPSKDAIWIGHANRAGSASTYHRTRALAEAALRMMLRDVSGRVLVGFDFPFGYPDGFAARLTGSTGAAAVWHWLAGHITDGPNNANNRFAVADRINAGFAGMGPFWGCPQNLSLPHLPARKTIDYPALGLAERRLIERRIPRAQSVWKLFTTGSVGSQALMGLPMIARLVQAGASVWPFDPPEARVVLAEVYPSLIDPAVARAMQSGEIKDAAQTRLLARALWQVAQIGGMQTLFETPPQVRQDEGWILGADHQPALLAALA